MLLVAERRRDETTPSPTRTTSAAPSVAAAPAVAAAKWNHSTRARASPAHVSASVSAQPDSGGLKDFIVADAMPKRRAATASRRPSAAMTRTQRLHLHLARLNRHSRSRRACSLRSSGAVPLRGTVRPAAASAAAAAAVAQSAASAALHASPPACRRVLWCGGRTSQDRGGRAVRACSGLCLWASSHILCNVRSCYR